MQLQTQNKALWCEGDSVSQWKECKFGHQMASDPNFTAYQTLGKSLNSVNLFSYL